MVMCHFVIYLSPPDGGFPGVYLFSDHVLGDPPAPIFLFLVGMSFILSVNAGRQRGLDESSIVRRGVIRALVIFCFGLVFMVIVWGYDSLWDWDVLTTIAAALLLLVPMRNLKPSHLIFIAVATVLLAPCLRHVFGYPAFWESAGEYEAPWTIQQVLGGFLLNAYFPLFPWISFAFFGAAVSKCVLMEPDAVKQARAGRRVLVWGALALTAGLLGLCLYYGLQPTGITALYVSGISFYPLSTTLFLVLLGGTMLTFQGLHRWLDNRTNTHWVMVFFRRYSRYALTIYVVHHFLVALAPRIGGIWLYQEDYYQHVMEAPAALAAGVCFIIASYPMLVLWDRHKGILSFEWLVAICVPKPVPKR